MIYPSEFAEKVRSEYAGSDDVVEAVESGRYGLGVLLSRGAAMAMSPEDIVTSIDHGDCESVRTDAERAVRRRSLHAEWMRIALRNISAIVSESPPARGRRLRPGRPRPSFSIATA